MDKEMVFVIYDRAIDEEVEEVLQKLEIKYYTKWKDVAGVGRNDPHLGDHVWPGLNNILMVVVESAKKQELLSSVEGLHRKFPSMGLRAFATPVIDMA
ncbi:MAG: PG0541 family transporter-associated protein [Spirochaetota bacterium]